LLAEQSIGLPVLKLNKVLTCHPPMIVIKRFCNFDSIRLYRRQTMIFFNHAYD